MTHHVYEVEIFTNEDEGWVKERRFYRIRKSLDAFDLHNVKDKRRNAMYLGTIEDPVFPVGKDVVII